MRDYEAPVFKGKDEQVKEVQSLLAETGFIPHDLIEMETDWFYNELGIDDMLFAQETAANITSYILSIYAAKVTAYTRDDHQLLINLRRERDDHAVFIDTINPYGENAGRSHYERQIDEKYLTPSTPEKAYRLETFWSNAGDDQDSQQQMRCYFAMRCNFQEANPAPGTTDLAKLSDKSFYEKASENTKELYQSILKEGETRMGPVIKIFEDSQPNTWRVVIGYKQGSSNGYFSALSSLYQYYGLTSTRKYVEQFSNGATILSLYLTTLPANPDSKKRYPPINQSINLIAKEASLLYCMPTSIFSEEFNAGKLSLQEAIYAHCGFIFVSHFLNRLGAEFESLMGLIDTSVVSNVELMDRLKRRLRGETFTREYIADLMRNQLDVVQDLYLHFANIHYAGNASSSSFLPTITYQRLQTDEVKTTEDLEKRIQRATSDQHQIIVLKALLRFNNHILKTNFYTPTKIAISFRLDPSFLPVGEYPQPLYGMFLVVGQEFRGFHLRFRDVARGGIRIVKSRNREAYSINARSMFDENYNLANTQQRKNKDIPEGGSKGVILLDMDHQNRAEQAFHKYIDAIIDILIPGESPGIKEPIVDLYGKQEILFMGPDENTAGLVDWATEHAKKRGAPWWKSFFTGKSQKYGGIPHDVYGMTSHSVRAYVEGIYRREKLENGKVRKMQTGGPDGDLGSNEILLSSTNEQYIAIVDGSGVIADPNGLDRDELLRLAKERKMVSNYDRSKLSTEGYLVLVEDTDVKLPNNIVVDNGTTFRNNYHVLAPKLHDIDIFVPCGGRPEAISVANVHYLIDEETGKARINYLVEGANLFITQTAKLQLEKAGVVVYKDASANKGGVTSSSLEVLSSLAFDDEGYFANMCVGEDGTVPEFYKQYVKGVQDRIDENARLEFEAIWSDHESTGQPRSILSDTLSNEINNLSHDLSSSNMWDDEKFRNALLREALPKVLVDKVGLDKIVERVPEAYLRAIFGSYLAGRYIYENGTKQNQFAFYEFMTHLRNTLLH